jgi:hypothetical protein
MNFTVRGNGRCGFRAFQDYFTEVSKIVEAGEKADSEPSSCPGCCAYSVFAHDDFPEVGKIVKTRAVDSFGAISPSRLSRLALFYLRIVSRFIQLIRIHVQIAVLQNIAFT